MTNRLINLSKTMTANRRPRTVTKANTDFTARQKIKLKLAIKAAAKILKDSK
jgi:hypothetical protein